MALTGFDAENRFKAMAGKGKKERGLELLKKLQTHYDDQQIQLTGGRMDSMLRETSLLLPGSYLCLPHLAQQYLRFPSLYPVTALPDFTL